jgi:co-chaperonin GroES (HSP10)
MTNRQFQAIDLRVGDRIVLREYTSIAGYTRPLLIEVGTVTSDNKNVTVTSTDGDTVLIYKRFDVVEVREAV